MRQAFGSRATRTTVGVVAATAVVIAIAALTRSAAVDLPQLRADVESQVVALILGAGGDVDVTHDLDDVLRPILDDWAAQPTTARPDRGDLDAALGDREWDLAVWLPIRSERAGSLLDAVSSALPTGANRAQFVAADVREALDGSFVALILLWSLA